MADIRSYIQSHILAPLKQYPTIIQDTMLEIIADKLEELYELSWRFPTIVTPNSSRLDILAAIAEQFSFTIREDADLQEQIDILDNILYVYNRRGSIDTIENMWKYYGGNLPKEVKVYVPSYNLYRYSVSPFSGTHSYVKGKSSSVTLDTPSPESIPSGSLVRVLGTSRDIVTTGVAKGSYIVNLANAVGLAKGDRVSVGRLYSGTIVDISSTTEVDRTVNTSGAYEIRLTNNTYPIADLKEFLLRELVAAGNEIYFTNDLQLSVLSDNPRSNHYKYIASMDSVIDIHLGKLYCTTIGNPVYISRDLYNDKGELLDSDYPGYFVLDSSLLGSHISGGSSKWYVHLYLGEGATYSGSTEIDQGAPLSATVVVDEDYEIDTSLVSVVMGGVPVRDSYTISGNTIHISITEVTGPIWITVPTIGESQYSASIVNDMLVLSGAGSAEIADGTLVIRGKCGAYVENGILCVK